MKKTITVLVLIALLGLGLQISKKISASAKQSGKTGKSRNGAAVIPVETAEVETMVIKEIGTFTGTLYPSTQFKLASKISGRLTKLYFHIGDYIRGGDIIALVDSEELEQALEQSKAELLIVKAKLQAAENTYEKEIEKAQADVDRYRATASLAEKDLKRLEELRRKSVASETDRDKAKEQLEVANAQLLSSRKSLELLKTEQVEEIRRLKAEILQAEAAMKADQIKLSYAQIKAEWSPELAPRIVGERYLDEGAMLSAGTALLSILEIDTLTATISVTEKDYRKIALNQAVELNTDAFPGRIFRGTINRIAPLLEESTRVARVDVLIPNAEHLLKPGMFVRANIVFDTHEKARVIPRAARVSRDGVEGVFVVDPKGPTAIFTPITVGITNQNQVEVLAPEITFQVVTLGHHMLSSGTPVLIASSEPAKKSGESAR